MYVCTYVLTLGVEDRVLLVLTSIPEKENNGSKRLSSTPSVSNLSLTPCRYLSTGNAEFKPRFGRWLQTGKVAKIGDLCFALGAKAS